jgi:hypothetical protein
LDAGAAMGVEVVLALALYSSKVVVKVTEVPFPAIGVFEYSPAALTLELSRIALKFPVAPADTLVISLMVLPELSGICNVIVILFSAFDASTVGLGL